MAAHCLSATLPVQVQVQVQFHGSPAMSWPFPLGNAWHWPTQAQRGRLFSMAFIPKSERSSIRQQWARQWKNRAAVSVLSQQKQDQIMSPPFNVLITGASKGIGYALAKEFLSSGDKVIICSRSEDCIKAATENLNKEFGDRVWGQACDVSDGNSIRTLVQFARTTIGYVDLWINNAGSNAYSYKPLVENDDESLMEVVATNALGSMLCCREAIKMMSTQPRGGHIFNVDGAGADGRPTPRYAAYGATKRSIVHLTKSLQAELKMQGMRKVIVHNLSPGMVTTDLLMSGSSAKQAKFFINVLAEHPDTVAKFLVPRIRNVPLHAQMRPTYIRFLTGFKAYLQIFLRLAFGFRKNRYLIED